jgi:putative CocE/NonD family hydrolase
MKRARAMAAAAAVVLGVVGLAAAQDAPAAAELTALLREFLAGASRNDAAVHDRFWADDLVYTGSAGKRRGKAELMADVRATPSPSPGTVPTVFTAEDIRIRQYGEAAVVAFRLVGTTGKEVAQYLNTGTFVRRDGRWQAVAWQATLMAAAPASAAAVERDVPVRMRDGVVLRADVWRPAGAGPFPVLVYRTPYDRRRAQAEASTVAHAAARGYAVVVQDVRGRYGSEGEFDPYRHEGRDGFDTIEWAAAQPWSNGAVGTFGLSYPGAVQWLAAMEQPPHLKAMVPAMTFSSPRNFFYSGGVFDMSWTTWIWNNIAPDTRVRRGLAGPRTRDDARAEWSKIRDSVQRRLPLDSATELREVAPYLFEWMRHPAGDPWWDWAELRGRYGRVSAAVLNISGWHDEAYGPEGAVTNFLGLRAARAGAKDARTKLLLGPWVHGGPTDTAEEQARSGERTFGSAAAVDYDEIVLRFLDRYVRGLDNGVDREPAVRAFVMGENAWRESDRWPLPETRARTLVLEDAAMRGRPGRLEWREQPRSNGVSSFVSDPARPVEDPYAAEPGAHDYRKLPDREDVVTFETAPMETDLRVVGPIAADMYVSADAKDTDVWVKLFDVAPDGTAFNLMSPGLDVLRASYRAGGPRRELLTPGQVYPLRFESLMTGNTFLKGHRLRLVVAGAFFPHFSRNLQTGELESTSAVSRPARLSVHHSARYPSRLVLPVVGP